MLDRKYAAFGGRLVIVGFGSIGQGALPLLLRHLEIRPQQIAIITAEPRGREIAAEYGIPFIEKPLTRENYRETLDPWLGPGDFLLNVAVEVSSLALIELCQQKGALYLDTCIEPWAGGYTDPVLTHGANPGLVSHFVKQALLDMAADSGLGGRRPHGRAEWAELAWRLGIKVIHIAERDTQVAAI